MCQYTSYYGLNFTLAAAEREKKYIDLLYDGKSVIYEGIVDELPCKSEKFRNICRKFRPYSYDVSETWDDSEDKLKRILLEHIGFLENENIAWDYYETAGNGLNLYNTRMETLYDDFDKDGKNEMYMMVIASDKRYELMPASDGLMGILMLICCADENGVATMGFSGGCCIDNGIKEFTFGKDRICIYAEDPYHGDSFYDNEGYELFDKNIYVMRINGILAQEDGAVRCHFSAGYVGPYMPYEEITLWYIDREFVECASVEIDLTSFMKYEGAEEIIQDINSFVFEKINDDYYWHDEIHYTLKNILFCGDGHIYVNCSAFDNNDQEYNDDGEIVDVALCFRINGDAIEYVDRTWGERACRVSSYKPYYPVIEE